MPDVSNPPGLTESGDVDHDQTSNRTHDGDSLTPATLEASDALGNPTYPTLSDVPTDLTQGTQVYVKDEDRIYVEDGT